MAELILTAAEAMAKDVGRGNVRIDPADMAAAGLVAGDVVEITCKRSTVARVLPAYPEFRGRGLMQIDGITRQNAGIGLGEKGRIRRVEVRPALQLVLLARQGPGPFEKEGRQLSRLLLGVPVVKGDGVRIEYFGSALDFTVLETVPAGPVLIEAATGVKVKLEKRDGEGQASVSYEDIGGLGKEIRKIREMLELPLKYPEVFAHLGIDPPRGVLLYGPPGTGKTLIARAVAHETNACFLHVNGPEIIHKYYGESEARLREIFEKARANAPSIIFLDEIDAVAPRREEVHGEVEKRVVAQLLALMDGLESRGQVVVIGATNIPNALDPALRRPGRFDREIAIGVPDQNGRLEILQIHTRGMPLAKDVLLEEIAGLTHGFVGADLQALCKEAAMLALRQALPQLEGGSPGGTSLEIVDRLQVCRRHFLQALNEVEPSALREVYVEIPHVEWEEVGGLEEIKRELREAVEWPLFYPELLREAGVVPAKGILLVGPPGTGKTLLARAVASASKANFISVKGPELFSKWVGESERAVRQIFRKARQATPCIVFFDEIDALVSSRGSDGDPTSDKVLGQLLTEIDGIEGLRGIIVLAATNRPDRIDPALLRPGRFDLVLTLPLPDLRSREQILRIHTAGKPLAGDVDLAELAGETEGFSGADLRYVCWRASWLAIRRFLAANYREGGAKRVPLQVEKEDFQHALALLKAGGRV
ncbi:cell division control protein 48 [Thermacetogenium phaeum DSM 12270]|uniref:Cell division control protein 48 n=1 Tax=Thermacetogenium phaeum (strain ATCC BAA-254 / DSM 26808 / PB) TaxID=1089553 RepID=K4LE37_THEPS|nr:CDC48 family AAA ATPase [Thermacetogenium phaeum]AFV11281.1 cell division control protein 48 [Thermacetogenium phaeum DSM 12270]